MKKLEIIYRELLDNVFEKKHVTFTQLGLAKQFSFSLSTVHHALKPLREIGAITMRQRAFDVVDTRKLLYYWATIRKFNKEIMYATRVEAPVQELERLVPSPAIFTAFSGYRLLFKEAPADYSELYFYIPESELAEVKERFPKQENGPQNVFALKADEVLLTQKRSIVSKSQLFVDLWNCKQWYAHEFRKKLEARLFTYE